MEENIAYKLLMMLSSDFMGAVQKVAGVAVVGIIVLFVVEKTLIKRKIVTDILPMWSMLMAYFLTMKGRLTEIERTSDSALTCLGVLPEVAERSDEERFTPEMWKSSAPGSTRYELKRALKEQKLTPAEQQILLAPLGSALVKLKNDSELFHSYSQHLADKMKSLWSEKLHLVNAVGGGIESVYVVSKEAEALDFYIVRHLDILWLYLENYLAGDRDEIVCENIANYWPYFIGQSDRLLATARDGFLSNNLGEKERKTLTLKGRMDFIEESLSEARHEIERKVKKELPVISVDTIWGR